MAKMDINFTLEEMDAFLRMRYGFGYWHFADSLFSVYVAYKWRDTKEYSNLAKKRIEKIEKIKNKFVELIDLFMTEIKFVEYSKYHHSLSDRGFVWTPNNRREFIINRFHLKPIYSELDEIMRGYRENPEEIFDTGQKMYIKPINLIIMIWSNVLKRKGRIEWNGLEALLIWFLKILEEIEVLDIYKIKSNTIPSPERMRAIYNRYRRTDHEKIAISIYHASFLDEESIAERKKMSFISANREKIDYADPMKYLDELLWLTKTPGGWLSLSDMIAVHKMLEDR